MADVRPCEAIATATVGFRNGVVSYLMHGLLSFLVRGAKCEITDWLPCGNCLISFFDNLRTVDGCLLKFVTDIQCVSYRRTKQCSKAV